MGTLLRRSLVVDGRNLYSPAKMQQLGFEYYSIGRGADAAGSMPAAPAAGAEVRAGR
jgi:hypothetical protein